MIAQDINIQDQDIVIRNGDFDITESDNLHIQSILNASPGWWREYPTCGCRSLYYLSSAGKQQEYERVIRQQLVADGFQLDSVSARVQNESFSVNVQATRL